MFQHDCVWFDANNAGQYWSWNDPTMTVTIVNESWSNGSSMVQVLMVNSKLTSNIIDGQPWFVWSSTTKKKHWYTRTFTFYQLKGNLTISCDTPLTAQPLAIACNCNTWNCQHQPIKLQNWGCWPLPIPSSPHGCQGTSSRLPRVFQTSARNPAARQHHWLWGNVQKLPTTPRQKAT